jgi:hypothetical protein
MKLLEGHNWVYTTHVFVVAPMLILIPLAVMNQKEFNLSDNLIKMLLYILIAFGIVVFLYHGNKLRTSL